MEKRSRIEDSYQLYINASSLQEILKLIPEILDYFISYGESNFRLNFFTRLNLEQKERFVHALFNYLIECNSADKLMVLDLLEVLYLDADAELRSKLLYIFYAALMEKHNFKLALAALSFFSHLWKNVEETDPIREEIFPKLLDFMDNKEPLLAEEGMFETMKLLEHSSSSRQRERVFETILEIAEKYGDPEVQYAAFDSLNELIIDYLSDLESFPPAILTERILGILQKNKHIKHPKAIFSLLRLILGNKFSEKETTEKLLFDLFKKVFKQITFEYLSTFWQALFDFIQTAGFISKTEIMAPFMDKFKDLFKHRNEIAPEVSAILENLITWLWDNEILSEKERSGFY